MDYCIWLIIGVILLAITIWVNKHTVGTTYQRGRRVADPKKKVFFPIWLLVLMIVFALIPVVNIITFFVFWTIWWVLDYADGTMVLTGYPKWVSSIIDFFTKIIDFFTKDLNE